MSPTAHSRKYGEKESRPIPLWNGVLEHRERIGDALWEFIWCLDKVTKERDGIGLVLGGAPVKISRVTDELKICDRSVRQHFDQLESGKYIRRRRTPYGFVIEVLNSRKFGIWRPRENGKNCRPPTLRERQELPTSPAKNADLTGEFCRNKEDAAVDSTVDAVEEAAAWKAIGTEKLGTPRFRAKWEFLFAHRNGNPLSDAMERCIVGCQGAGVKVPPPFFDAKRRIETSERIISPAHNRKGGGLPYLPSMPPLPCPSRS